MKTFSMPPGYRVELVASEPMIESPILMDFDADGRLWVLEMLTFLPDTSGRDSREPLNRVSVLEDTNGDGKMDKKTVFADKLSMPRALKVLDHGVLVGEPPNLWLMKDTDGDLKADTKDLVVNTYGNPNGGIEHNANSLFWAMDNVMYSSEHVWDLRWQNGKFESAAGAEPRPVADLAGRRGTHLPQRERLAAVRRLHAVALLPPQSQRRPDARPLRAADRADGRDGLSGAEQPRRQPRLPRSVLSRGRLVDRHSRRQRADHLSRRRLPEGPARQRVHRRLADQSRAPHGGDRRRVGPADGEERLRARRVPRVVGRAVPSGEPVRRPGRQHVRGRHVSRRRAGGRPLERLPHRLHQGERHGTAGRQGPDLARRLRDRARRGVPRAPALSKATPAAAGADAVESEGLVARHGAAAPGRAWRHHASRRR